MEQARSYKEQWETLRRANRYQIFFFMGFLPFVFLFVCLFAPHLGAQKASFISGCGYIVCGLVFGNRAAIRAKQFACPRCGKRFFGTGNRHNDFTRKCMNCGLKKYAHE